MLQFSDGMHFDTSGPYRLTSRRDGWYVVGNGMLIPVNDKTEGTKVINMLNSEREKGRK
jgi:hypothetical protein